MFLFDFISHNCFNIDETLVLFTYFNEILGKIDVSIAPIPIKQINSIQGRLNSRNNSVNIII